MSLAPRSGSRLVVALDYPDAAPALAMAARLDPSSCRLKIGKELFTAEGPDLVRAITGLGFEVFLDLKFHDIPNTVAGAVRAAAALGVWMVNVHASGGRRMMEAARDALGSPGQGVPLLTAVTVLTSMDATDLAEMGITADPQAHVQRLAALSVDCRLDGVVCSAREVALLRHSLGPAPVLVTPGIRPVGSDIGDQRRTMGPRDALLAGSDFLVVGRPITAALDPGEALRSILSEISYSNLP